MTWTHELKQLIAHKIWEYRDDLGLYEGHSQDTDYEDAERFLRMYGDDWLKSKESVDGPLRVWLDSRYTDRFNNHITQTEDLP